ncbi:MAG: cation-translocating P-type ATPase [Cyclobacteriaceae bacterium]
MNWHSLPLKEVYSRTDSTETGLSATEAEARLVVSGLNELQVKKKKPVWKLLLGQFSDFMIIVLMVAAVISGVIGDFTDAIVILVILILNAIIGFVQEYRAEKAMEALQKLAAPMATVIRDGKPKTVSATLLIPGDKVLLKAGDAVPADIRLIETHSLRLDEASLTGESNPIDKIYSWLTKVRVPLGERLNMAYKGTLVTYGRGSGIVVATGMDTEIGQIARMLQEEEPLTPLQIRLASFGKKLSYLVLIICAVLYAVGLWQGEDPLEMLLVAISVAVAAIPEALPAVVTIALALGAKRLIKKNALIRKLPAVETLGSVTYICSDKTGTITKNKMTVKEILPHCTKLESSEYSILELGMVLNNDVKGTKTGQWLGDPTEVALVEFAVHKLGPDSLDQIVKNYPRLAEIPFDSERKCMTTIHSFGERFIAISKGASESIATRLENHGTVERINQQTQELAQKGMRVLTFAYRYLDKIPEPLTAAQIERDLKFVGLVGMIDPPRSEVKAAIAECRTAGIHPVMITGDHPVTAKAIAQEIGILKPGDLLVTGAEMEKVSPEALDERVEKIAVYARVTPEQKLNIVKSLQKKDHFVAMTGDGVNDAPSLKIANIGVAMGIMGTEVSKEAAHMILLDDNFATIVRTVKEGRRIFDNIRKFIKYTMTSNSGEIWTIFLAPLVGLPIPLLPIHILWINLVTDGLPGLALTLEPPEKDIMNRPPRPPGERIFAHGMGKHILWVGLLMGAVCLGLQAWAIEQDISRWQTMVFTVLCLSQMGHVFAVKSDRQFLYKQGLLSNRYLFGAVALTFLLQLGTIYLPFANQIFKTQPLSLDELLICIGASAIVFHAVELEKWINGIN